MATAGRMHPLEDRSSDREAAARHWGRTAPPRRVRPALDAACARSHDPGAAAHAAREAGGEPTLAAGLVGLVVGAQDPDPALVALVERLTSVLG